MGMWDTIQKYGGKGIVDFAVNPLDFIYNAGKLLNLEPGQQFTKGLLNSLLKHDFKQTEDNFDPAVVDEIRFAVQNAHKAGRKGTEYSDYKKLPDGTSVFDLATKDASRGSFTSFMDKINTSPTARAAFSVGRGSIQTEGDKVYFTDKYNFDRKGSNKGEDVYSGLRAVAGKLMPEGEGGADTTGNSIKIYLGTKDEVFGSPKDKKMTNVDKLLQTIKDKESFGGNYNILSKDKKSTNRNLTGMTINEVLAEQAKNQGRAAGAYQIIPSTMRMLMEQMNLTGDEKFDESMQDRMAKQLLIHRGLEDVQAGRITSEEFGNNLAKEWASLPLLADIDTKKTGESYYQGKWGNTSRVSEKELPLYFETIKGFAPDPEAQTFVKPFENNPETINDPFQPSFSLEQPVQQTGTPMQGNEWGDQRYATMEDLLMDKGLLNPLLKGNL